MSIIKHVTLQKIVAHDFRYGPRNSTINTNHTQFIHKNQLHTVWSLTPVHVTVPPNFFLLARVPNFLRYSSWEYPVVYESENSFKWFRKLSFSVHPGLVYCSDSSCLHHLVQCCDSLPHCTSLCNVVLASAVQQ